MTAELPSQTDVVQAAGGLVVRRQGGRLQIVVVHRPVQQDWSFPKGKLEAGETLDGAALREVHEETGMTCELLRFIGIAKHEPLAMLRGERIPCQYIREERILEDHLGEDAIFAHGCARHIEHDYLSMEAESGHDAGVLRE